MEKKDLIENVKLGILEAFLTEESPAAKQAKSLGLKYVGFGRYSDGKTTYKSDGQSLIAMDKSKEKTPSKENFLQKFVKKCNEVAESKKSGNSLLETMISLLPGKEKGEHFGKTQVLEQVLNSAIPYFNKYVLLALKNKNFRTRLLKKYLDKFQKDIGEQDPLKDNPEVSQQTKQPQQQMPMSVSKPNVAKTSAKGF